ncbi:MAG TPA: phosphodiester glycosidase family protein [bacterium]|nr:phosphodiester glycosidase family protein [bacterium]
MRHRFRSTIIVATILLSPLAGVAGDWAVLAPGLELGEFKAQRRTSEGDSLVLILRVDPVHWELIALTASDASRQTGNLTARQWCERYGLAAAINAGMYQEDFRTHVGYMRCDGHVNSAGKNNYQSVAAFAPRRDGLPPFRIVDLDQVEWDTVMAQYDCVIQNLRLIARPGDNRWSPSDERWSEAALGEDRQGRILFIFCRSPYPMHEFNNILLELPIDLVCAQHLEGGPEAQFYLRYGSITRDVAGSYETGFNENDHNREARPLPNVLGIVPRDTLR